MIENTFGINIIPDNDSGRLLALKRYRIMDTPSEASFDNIADLCTKIFKVPISLISLVDAERVFFKANVGMGKVKEANRGKSLCALAVLDPEVTIFEDALKEPCLIANPNVAGEFGLRFYAGAPLITYDGFLIGTLCIIDQQPRVFSKEEEIILKGLATAVMDQIELRLSALEEIGKQQTTNKELIQQKEEVQSINEELTVINEELNESRQNLQMLNENLKKSEKRFRELIEQAPVAISIYSGEELIIEAANAHMLDLLGRTAEIIGQPLLKARPELITHPYLQVIRGVLESGKDHIGLAVKAPVLRLGKIVERYYDVNYRAIKDEWGKVTGVIAVGIDVSEKIASSLRETEMAEELAVMNEELLATNEDLISSKDYLMIVNEHLNKSESRFRGILQQATAGIMVCYGKSLIIESVNDTMLTIISKSKDIIQRPFADAMPELKGQPFLKLLDDVYTSGLTYIANETKVIVNRNGELVEGYFNISYQAIKGDNELITGILIVATDVTQQVASKKAVQKAEDMLRFSIEAANIGTFIINQTTRVMVASPRLKEIFGYYPDEEMPYDAAVVQISEEHREHVLASVEAAFEKGEDYFLEYSLTGFHDQQLRWVRAVGKLNQYTADGEMYFSGAIIDITEQKQDEQRKNDFIAMVSHELKTPLTSLKGYLQILEQKAKKAQESSAILMHDKASTQVKRMISMINGFLNVSRLDSGKIHIAKECFNMTSLFKEADEEACSTISTHQVVFSQIESAMLNADRDKIGQVINNFISNAVKYSPSGSLVTVNSKIIGRQLLVEVKDQGRGIKPEDKDKLFDRFYRVVNDDVISGFGIGLYLCAEIIERHEGEIGVESKFGEGSTFWFSLPIYEN
ncbi:PAS domain S-box-containing protein [Pedobacter cryoconitis]|uniref:ATP-binding protein n=1 Tax=Pedobacter cryoconitis TaxID=188932 RepID=UPI00161FDD4F|nr:ATP-binding protein [Pedobacter cryoconitis]MBB6271074.1 PAS domain S-box-containing protein [Pedobacter cryoconitis]